MALSHFYAYRTDNADAVTSQPVSMKNVLGYKAVLETLYALTEQYRGHKITSFFKRRVFFYLSELYYASLVVEEKEAAQKIYVALKERFTFSSFDLKLIDIEEQYIEKIRVLGESKKAHFRLNLMRKAAKFYIRTIMHRC